MKIVKAKDLTNEEYHLSEGYSSSQIKDAVEDIELFFKKYILKEIARKVIPAFNVGTYFHTAILEPEKLDIECTVFSGKIRSGYKWKEFQEANVDKTIITSSEKSQADNLIKAVNNSPRALELLTGGEAELSAFSELLGINSRVRADYINLEKGYILDLKSTTGNVKNERDIATKISSYNYDMSAAMYIDVFNYGLGGAVIKDFYWVFASKDEGGACKTYRMTDTMYQVGKCKYQFGIEQIKKYAALNWTFPDEISWIDPVAWDKDKWFKRVKPHMRRMDIDLI